MSTCVHGSVRRWRGDAQIHALVMDNQTDFGYSSVTKTINLLIVYLSCPMLTLYNTFEHCDFFPSFV